MGEHASNGLFHFSGCGSGDGVRLVAVIMTAAALSLSAGYSSCPEVSPVAEGMYVRAYWETVMCSVLSCSFSMFAP